MHVVTQNIILADKPATEGCITTNLLMKTVTSDNTNHYHYCYLFNRLECNVKLSTGDRKLFTSHACQTCLLTNQQYV